MKRLLSAAVVITTLSGGTAFAADLSARPYTKAPAMAVDPAYDWSGFYIGGHAGYLWGKTRVVDTGVLTEPGAPTDGFVGGLLVGYNWQSGPVVYGLEGDIGWSDARGTGLALPPATPNIYRLNWNSHVVGKLGYTSGQWMFFGTGGLAVADFDFQEGFVPPAPPTQVRGGTYVGFSVGGGVEYAFTRNLHGRLQYIYDDYGSKTYVIAPGDFYQVKFTSQTLRGALTWRF